MFDDCLDWQHRDYPLFLSATIARSFVFSGTRSSIVPALYALLFTISCFLLVYLYLRKLRQGYFGVIALTILSARSDIVWEGSRQYADLPLMVFILISLFEYTVWVTDKQKSPLPCIVFASFALWTKNEGIVFFILVNLWLYKNSCLGLKRLLGYLAVTIPVLISKYMVVLFANSSNDLMFGASSRLSNFLQAHRYFYLASYVMEFLVQNIWLISIPIILVVDLVDNRFKKVCNLLFIPFFAYLFYFLMYFITPHEIQWHLSTSFRRIIMHYVPALAFLVCLIFSDEKLIKNKNSASYA